MRNQAQTASIAWAQRAATIMALAGLLLAAGTDWARAATLRQLAGPETGEILVTVLIAASAGLFALLIRQGAARKTVIRGRRRSRR